MLMMQLSGQPLVLCCGAALLLLGHCPWCALWGGSAATGNCPDHDVSWIHRQAIQLSNKDLNCIIMQYHDVE